jgi:NCS1 family nucleobase:cation symporter-1
MAGLTGNIAFWATIALNIPDFSRYAKSQKSQFWGQFIGMPIPMFMCAYIGAYFAMATKLAYGTAMFDPTGVFYYVENKLVVIICALGVAAATITTCVAANIVAPANGFSNLKPTVITYKKGVIVACILAIAFQPWWIFGSGAAYVFTWLNNYGTILAPVAAIFIADYYVHKQKRVDVAALYNGDKGRYWYKGGWNMAAVIAWIGAFIIPLLGNTVFLYNASLGVAPGFFDYLAANGYLVSFAVGFFLYLLLMSKETKSKITEEEHEALTDRQ